MCERASVCVCVGSLPCVCARPSHHAATARAKQSAFSAWSCRREESLRGSLLLSLSLVPSVFLLSPSSPFPRMIGCQLKYKDK